MLRTLCEKLPAFDSGEFLEVDDGVFDLVGHGQIGTITEDSVVIVERFLIFAHCLVQLGLVQGVGSQFGHLGSDRLFKVA